MAEHQREGKPVAAFEQLEDRLLLASWSGDIPDGTVWTGGQVHQITGDVTVPLGATLTIEPGAVVKFGHYQYDLLVNGTLNADGTAAAPIVFTEWRDDTGGDTNGDGAASSPWRGNWRAIQFTATSTDSVMDFCEVRYGGYSQPGEIFVNGGELTLTHSTISSSGSAGVRIEAAHPTLTNNTYQNSSGSAVAMDLASNPAIQGVTVANNGTNGLRVDSGTLVGEGFWDDPDIVYVTQNDITVSGGSTLTLAPGQVVKFGHYLHDLVINGTLLADGTAGAPIVFTELRDDTAGDTNGDGAVSNPWVGSWRGIQFTAASTGSVMDYCEVRYGGYSLEGEIYVDGGELTLTNSMIASSNSAGVRIIGARPVLTNITYQHNAGAAVRMDVASNPDVQGVTVTNNGTNGLRVDGGTLVGDGFWDDPDIVYVTDNDITVPDGSTLTIAPGQVVKFGHYQYDLFVDGTLSADGTAAAPIVFTEWDDDAGGDTNNNADATSPWRNSWRAIRFGATSTGSVMDYCEIRYGAYSSEGMVTVTGGELTLTHSTIASSNSAGVRIVGASPTLTDNTYQNNGGDAVRMDVESNPSIQGVTVTNNGTNGLRVDGGTLVGDGVWDDPDIVYVIGNDITVPDGSTLTVAPGQVVKFGHYQYDLFVDGTLNADGTAGAPIVFTEWDDDIGGDTNNNADATSPWRNEWRAVQFSSTSTGSVMDYCEVRYGAYGMDGMVIVNGGELTLTNSTIASSESAGVRIVGANPTLTNNTYQDNNGDAVRMDVASNPVIQGVTMINNGTNGLRVDGGTLVGAGVWDDPDIVYVTRGDITVAQGSTLTIAPGQVVKFGHYQHDLLVNGTLNADGTAWAPIVFTELDDDTGGDTNNNADATGAVWNEWGAVVFGPTSRGSVMDYCKVRYGGYARIGEILVEGGRLTLTSSLVSNSRSRGVALSNNGSATIADAIIVNNGSDGIGVFSASTVTVYNSTIDGNRAGVWIDSSTARLTNNLITNGWYAGVGVANVSTVTMTHNDLYNPAASEGNYKGLADQTGAGGNIAGDPLYVDRAGGDYTPGDGSPAIDAGTRVGAPPQDFFGRLRYDDPAVPNAGGSIIEYTDIGAIERNGIAPLDIDLVVSDVSGPTSGEQDGDVTVNWITANDGTVSAAGSWYDAVYLSLDALWSPDDLYLGSVQHTGGLAAGADYAGQGTFHVRGMTDGDYSFIVRSDTRHEVLEGASRDNNLAPSAQPIAYVMSVLTLGTPEVKTFTSADQAHFLSVDVPPGYNLYVQLDDADDAGQNELYARFGQPPALGVTAGQYGSAGGADQDVFVSGAAPGTWYVMSYSAYGTGDYTLTAEITQVDLRQVTPDSLGNGAEMVLTLEGAGFLPGTTVELVADGGATYLAAVEIDSFSRIMATFGAGAVPGGVYTVRVAAQGGGLAELADALTVAAGGQATLETNLIAPSQVGYHQLATLYVEYANTGDLAVPAPLLAVTANQDGRQAGLMTLDQSRITTGFWTSGIPEGFSNTIYVLGSGEIPGILQPGESGRVPVYYAGWQKPWDFSYPPITFDLIAVTSESTYPLDWSLYESDSRPGTIEPDAWAAIWNSFSAEAGSTWGDFMTVINDNASYLGRLGQGVDDIIDLWQFEIAQADALQPFNTFDSQLDVAFETPGLPLLFQRDFQAPISGRYETGPFGRGWTTPWQEIMTEADDGTVSIISPDGLVRIFQPDSRGGYLAEQGDKGILADLGGGAFSLRESDAFTTVYLADGRVDYVHDANGQRITCGYSGDNLMSLTHSSGPSIGFAYNAAGLIERVTGPSGDDVVYTYDLANEHLLAVDHADGTSVRYTYATGQGAPREHALTGIEYRDGTHHTLSYDARGRLETIRGDSGVDLLALTYDSTGNVTFAIDGGEPTISFNDQGLPLKIEGADGQIYRLEWNDSGSVTRIVDPLGRFLSYTYDANGDLESLTNALGQTTTFTYAGPGTVAQVSDPRGSVTQYGYDARGNVGSVTYDDGSVEYYSYDAAGGIVQSTDRSGTVMGYSYDSNGRLVNIALPDGSAVSYTYDARGNLLSATDANGAIDYTYDAHDNMTRVDYPGGRYIEFTHDGVGRRMSMTDQDGFAVNYDYDAWGRLSGLTDAGANDMVSYTYDGQNRLIREDKGGGTYTTYEYDQAGRTDLLTNYAPGDTTLSYFDYTFDLLGQVAAMDTADGLWTYTYDAMGQLIGATFASSNAQIADQDLTYEYDAAGNRIQTVVNGSATTYAANALDQYTQVGSTVYGYNADGSLTSRVDGGQTWTYEYDALNRLVGTVTPDGTWEYEYNAMGDRTAVTLDGLRTEYLYDPMGINQIVGEFDQAGDLVANYAHGLGLAGRFDAVGGAGYYDFDILGSVVGLANDAGSYVNSYTYTPFGQVLDDSETVANPFQYVGQMGVTADGSGLYHMRARDYLLGEGRFLSTDPLGQSADLNLYRYVDNAPMSFIDPEGTDSDGPDMGIFLDGTGFNQVKYMFVGAWERGLGKFLDLDVSNCNGTQLLGGGTTETSWDRGKRVLSDLDTINTIKGWLTDTKGQLFTGGRDFFANVGTRWASGSEHAKKYLSRTFRDLRRSANKYYNKAGDYWNKNYPRFRAWAGEALDAFITGMIAVGQDIITGAQNLWQSEVAGAVDPNEKTGPAGFGVAAYMQADGLINYRVDFENDSTATSPAQIVTITDQLSADLDWATFELTEVGFGDTVIAVPAGVRHFVTTVPMSYLGVDFEVEIDIDVNLQTGVLRANFYSIDPAFGIPPAVAVGFLPPEDDTGRGMGYFNYVIEQAPGLATATEIRNIAVIQFDFGEIIATNQIDPHDPSQGTDPAREALVTIDSGAPASQVAPLAAISPLTEFLVTWSGQDDAGGSGVASYDIYVATDGEDYVRWQERTTETEALFTGEVGHLYAFYSRARDNVGNIEDAPALADGAKCLVNATGAGVDTLVTDRAITLGANTSLEIVPVGGGDEFQAGTYTVINASGGLSGAFANVTDLGAYVSVNGNGLTYDEAAGTVTLTLDMPLHPADGNLDGATDVSDRIIWNNHNFTFGTTFRTGDYNGDGATDVSDRIIWNNNNFTFATAAPGPLLAPLEALSATAVSVQADAEDASAAAAFSGALAAGAMPAVPAEPTDGELAANLLVSMQTPSMEIPTVTTTFSSQIQSTSAARPVDAVAPVAAQLEPDIGTDLADTLGEQLDAAFAID